MSFLRKRSGFRIRCRYCSSVYYVLPLRPKEELEWSDQGVEGSFRFINRVWRVVSHFQGELVQKVTGYDTSKLDEADKELRRVLHNTIKKVTDDIEQRFNFNTAISAMMELVDALYVYKEAREKLQCRSGL